jgi:hypothetical protein
MHENRNNPGAVGAAPGARSSARQNWRNHSELPAGEQGRLIYLPVARIVPDRDGGWLVLTHRGHGWLHGDRISAIREKKWLDAQWWGQR